MVDITWVYSPVQLEEAIPYIYQYGIVSYRFVSTKYTDRIPIPCCPRHVILIFKSRFTVTATEACYARCLTWSTYRHTATEN